MQGKKVLPFIVFSAAALAVGGLSALLSADGMEAAKTLLQPPYAPPDWLFPVMWTVLYILMGISAALVWRAGEGAERLRSLRVWTIQLIVNSAWSIIFFAFALRGIAFFWVLALIVLVFIMIIRFFRVSRIAALLQVPYFLWICFAARLNLAVWLLNR